MASFFIFSPLLLRIARFLFLTFWQPVCKDDSHHSVASFHTLAASRKSVLCYTLLSCYVCKRACCPSCSNARSNISSMADPSVCICWHHHQPLTATDTCCLTSGALTQAILQQDNAKAALTTWPTAAIACEATEQASRQQHGIPERSKAVSPGKRFRVACI